MALDWDKLRVFHAVALSGSFSKASRDIHISQSALSRQINIIEDELGAILFERTVKGLELTPIGEKLNGVVNNVFSKVAMAEAAIIESRNRPYGHITVGTSLVFGAMWLSPRIEKFLKKYPEITIDIKLLDGEIDFNLREADIGITLYPSTSTDIVSSEPKSYPYRIYGHKSYIEKYGAPKSIEELDHHRIIAFGKSLPYLPSIPDPLLSLGSSSLRTPFMEVNSGSALLEVINSGLGLGRLHKYMTKDYPELVEVLPGSLKTFASRYIMYPKQVAHLKRIQVFAEFVASELENSEL